jgi:hypothetical protein
MAPSQREAVWPWDALKIPVSAVQFRPSALLISGAHACPFPSGIVLSVKTRNREVEKNPCFHPLNFLASQLLPLSPAALGLPFVPKNLWLTRTHHASFLTSYVKIPKGQTSHVLRSFTACYSELRRPASGYPDSELFSPWILLYCSDRIVVNGEPISTELASQLLNNRARFQNESGFCSGNTGIPFAI